MTCPISKALDTCLGAYGRAAEVLSMEADKQKMYHPRTADMAMSAAYDLTCRAFDLMRANGYRPDMPSLFKSYLGDLSGDWPCHEVEGRQKFVEGIHEAARRVGVPDMNKDWRNNPRKDTWRERAARSLTK